MGGGRLAYQVNFENDASALSPAQEVILTDPLSDSLDLATLELTEVAFGDRLIVVPTGRQHYEDRLELWVGDVPFELEIEVGVRQATRELYAVFRSIDPSTGLPPPVAVGFLPPEDGTGRGQGHISYLIKTRTGLTTGTEIRNVALISFDRQTALPTNLKDPHDPSQGTDPDKEAWNTIDADAPSSAVLPLPSQVEGKFIVEWLGDDLGAGVASYDIYVAENQGPWQVWLQSTTEGSATFPGNPETEYAFYSVAHDRVGHTESPPETADATTTVRYYNRPPVLTVMDSQTLDEGTTFTVTATAHDPDVGDTLTFALLEGPEGAVVQSSTGQLNWEPGEEIGPSAWTFSIVVTDSGVPPLSDTNSFLVRVNEVNAAPVLTAVADQTVVPGGTVEVLLEATDPDLPPNTLQFLLLEGPDGAEVDPVTGHFHWTTLPADSGRSLNVTVAVQDDAAVRLAASRNFMVNVREVRPRIGPQGLDMTAEGFVLRFSGEPGLRFMLEASEDLREWEEVGEVAVGPEGEGVATDGAPGDGHRFYRLRWIE